MKKNILSFQLYFFFFVISFFIIFLTSNRISAKTGTGYFFKNKRVMKKFYINTLKHRLNKTTDRVYKGKGIILTPSQEFKLKAYYVIYKKKNSAVKKFKVIPSPKNTLINVRFDKQIIRGLFTPARREDVLTIRGYFAVPSDIFLELRPTKEIALPLWTKSIDFWMLSSNPDLKISFYFRYPNGLEIRYNITKSNKKGWDKVFINLIHGSTKNLYQNLPIKLTKIRIKNPKNLNSYNNFSLHTSLFQAYNFLKSSENLYLNPYETFADFEKGHPRHWKYTFDNRKMDKKIWSIQDHSSENLIQEDNKKYLALLIPKELHKNRNMLIHLPVGFYKLKKGHRISIWIKGDGKGEGVSLLFQEGKHRYFELELGEIYFKGWRKLTVELPKDKISYFITKSSLEKYIILIGIKIACNVISKEPIDIGLDQIEGIVEPNKLGSLKDL